MTNLTKLAAAYVAETKKLAAIPTSTELTFYPEIKALLTAILKDSVKGSLARSPAAGSLAPPPLLVNRAGTGRI